MKAWIKLTTDDLALVFNAKELAVVAPSGPDSANPWTLDTLDHRQQSGQRAGR